MTLDINKFQQYKSTIKYTKEDVEEIEDIGEVEHSATAQAILNKRSKSTGPTLADLLFASVIYSNKAKAKEKK